MESESLVIVKKKLSRIYYFLQNFSIFEGKNLIAIFKLFSPNEQYYLFLKLNEKQKLTLISKKNVLSTNIYIKCCKETDSYKAFLLSHTKEDRHKAKKDWHKEHKDKTELGKKMASLVALLEKLNNESMAGKEEILRDIIAREKWKVFFKKIAFGGLFLFCSAWIGLAGWLCCFVSSALIQLFINTIFGVIASVIGIKGYSKIMDSYLREEKLIDMLQYCQQSVKCEKNDLAELPATIDLLEKKMESKKKLKFDIQTEDFDANYDIGPLKDKKSNFKVLAKGLFYIGIALLAIGAIAGMLCFPPIAALFTVAIPVAILQITAIILGVTAVISYLACKGCEYGAKKTRERVEQIRNEQNSLYTKKFDLEIVEQALNELNAEIEKTDEQKGNNEIFKPKEKSEELEIQ